MATYQDLEFDEGDDFSYKITLTDSAGAAIDLTGYTFYMTVKKKKNDSDANAVFKKTVVTIPNPTLGIVTISIDSADTTDVTPGIYPYDIKYKNASSDIRTVLYGNFKLVQAITDVV